MGFFVPADVYGEIAQFIFHLRKLCVQDNTDTG
ncbi:hypothetical protein C8P63_10654 [Melghirimyces profundicolus]|uniref:Uncharacterized protein n=1 Tax=Melghirimyces profundicolus TaxID=1242148 RepID=A0A2T6C0G8_9BACL|nr:hypothetical protein C8P63_10654 [Melghirimyces profundicolus]